MPAPFFFSWRHNANTRSHVNAGTGKRLPLARVTNGVLQGTGGSGAAIASIAAGTFVVAWNPTVGGNNHNGQLPAAASHQALSAAESLALSNAMVAYRTAML